MDAITIAVIAVFFVIICAADFLGYAMIRRRWMT